MTDAAWFHDLYGDVEGFIEIRAFPGIKPCDCKPPKNCSQCILIRSAGTPDMAIKFAEEIATSGEYNVYTGMATRTRAGAGGKKDLRHCRVLWIDFDPEEEGAREEFDIALEQFTMPPSYVTNSGGGIHCFWLLEEPIDVSEPAGREWLEETLAGLRDVFKSDRKVVDSARIMRVPGTVNYPDEKKLAKGREVCPTSVLQRGGHVYERADFDSLQERGQALRKQQRGEAPQPPSAPTELPEKVRSVLESDANAKRLFLHDEQGLPGKREDTSASAFDYHLIARLLTHPTLTKYEIVATAKLARERAGSKPKTDPEYYWNRTYQQAWNRQREPREQPRATDVPARFRQVMRETADRVSALVRDGKAGQTIEEHAFSMEVDNTLRFPTGIEQIDEALQGGLYGVATVSGQKAVGKSTLINQILLNALEHGWTVAMFDAENAGNVFNRRVLKWYGLPSDQIQRKLVNMRRFWVQSGVTFEDILEWACASVQSDTRKLLIGLDSFNTIITKMTIGRRQGYFDVYDQLLLWCQDVRVASRGHIAVLMSSEMNQNDVALGRKIEFIEDCGLAISTAKDGNMKLRVEKSRESKRPDPVDLEVTEDYHVRPVALFDDSQDGDDDPQPEMWWDQ